jgi:tetratricopeptide (TPR) repeat protein/tRNA A-37 threonylcarbamoyl transferase component Bud32
MPTSSSETRATAESAVPQSPPPSQKINGRYRPVRKLGRGGMGAVFLVLDTYHGDQPVALKRVRPDRLDRKAEAILRNEYLALAGLQHPGLARVFHFGLDHDASDYFFTSEFVDGVNLLKACQGIDLAEPQSCGLFLDMLAQILRALEYIHARGLVHGDLKPENMLVTGIAPDRPQAAPPRVKLIDFGLTKREKEFGGKKVLGTTYYIAPETITGSQVDRRTDLYSLGVILYQLATGQVPFEGESNAAILKKHVEQPPSHPCEVKPSVPAGLGEIILNLMEKRPLDRFQSAFAVLDAVNRAFGLELPLETPETCASYVQSAELVGRDLDLRRLYAAFCSACKVKPVEIENDLNLPAPPVQERGPRQISRLPDFFLLLRGETGIGKRRLALEFKKYAETQGVQFVGIECSQNDAANPHADFLALMRDLLGFARLGGDRPQVLLRVAELVKEMGGSSKLPPAAGELFQELALYVLRASQLQPLIVHFHDLQRGGKLVMTFLSAMVSAMTSQDRNASGRLLLSASALDRIDCEKTLLQELLHTPLIRDMLTEICLERLDAEGVARLLSAMFAGHDFPPAFRRRVFEESDGNPGVVQEICELFLGEGLIGRTMNGWTLTGDHEKQSFPGRVRRELKEKIERLPGPARKMAVAFACLGNSSPLELAVRLSELPRDKILDSMQVLHRQKILREDTSGHQLNVYSFVHATARDLLTEAVGPEYMRTLNDRAGTICEEYFGQQGKKPLDRLAVHFLRAGNRARGVQYGLEAAKAASGLEPRRAADLYAEVLRVGAGDRVLEDRVQFEMARLRCRMGQHQEAINALIPLLETRRPDGNVPAPAQLLVELAHNLIRTGEFKRAGEYLDKAFSLETGQAISAWMVHVILGYAELHHALGCHEESLRSCQRVYKLKNEIHDARLLGRLYALLVENHFHLGDTEAALNHSIEAIQLTDTRSDLELVESNLFFLGLKLKYEGKLSWALREFELCARLRKKKAAAGEEADLLREIGTLEIRLERPRQAAERLCAALTLHESHGLAESASVLAMLAEARRMLGEYEDAKKAVAEALRRGKASRNPLLLASAYITCGNISLDHGDNDNAERYFKETRTHLPDHANRLTRLLQGEYRLAFERGRFGTALDLAAQGLDLAKKQGSHHDSAWFSAERAFLFLKLGRFQDARFLLVTLGDRTRRQNFRACESRAILLQGLLLMRENGWEGAKKAIDRALAIAKDEGSERDLIRIYFEQGGLNVHLRDYERAILAYEEGLYLAKKLNLVYWKCALQHAMGVLEASVENGDLDRAEDFLAAAAKYARHGSYADLQWQIHYQQGKVIQRAGREEEALARFEEATAARLQVLNDLPVTHREAYVAQSTAGDLDGCRSEAASRCARAAAAAARATSEAPAARTKVFVMPVVPVEEPAEAVAVAVAEPWEEEPPQTLLGKSEAIRRLREQIAGLPEVLPWVWVLGPRGSGKLQTARAIHEQLAAGGGRIWVHGGAELDDALVESVLAELEQARKEEKAGGGSPGKASRSSKLAPPRAGRSPRTSGKERARPRFTLVLRSADKQPSGARALLLEALGASEAGDFGVVATVDTRGGPIAKLTMFGPPGAPVLQTQPLADRREDLEVLAAHFLGKARRNGEPAPALSAEALAVLGEYEWPGNVAELKALCEALAAAARPGEPIGGDLVRRVLASLVG